MNLADKILKETEMEREIDAIRKKYPELIAFIHFYPEYDAIKIASLKVLDKANRRQGVGSAFMRDICAYCDQKKYTIVLSPDGAETPITVLKRFYKSFGFKPNTGGKKDFRFMASMIRLPK